MCRRLNQLINVLSGCFIGAFFAYGGCVYWDYKTHPMVYEYRSAPWYTGILLQGIILTVILAVCVVVKILIRIWSKRRVRVWHHNALCLDGPGGAHGGNGKAGKRAGRKTFGGGGGS